MGPDPSRDLAWRNDFRLQPAVISMALGPAGDDDSEDTTPYTGYTFNFRYLTILTRRLLRILSFEYQRLPFLRWCSNILHVLCLIMSYVCNNNLLSTSVSKLDINYYAPRSLPRACLGAFGAELKNLFLTTEEPIMA